MDDDEEMWAVLWYLTLSAAALFSAKYKIFFFFFRKFIASSVFMLERDIKRPFFLEKGLNFFFFI